MAYNYKLRVKHLIEKAGSSNPAVIAEMLGINIRYVDTPNNINGFGNAYSAVSLSLLMNAWTNGSG